MASTSPGERHLYGITVDEQGTLYVCGISGNIYRVNAKKNAVSSHNAQIGRQSPQFLMLDGMSHLIVGDPLIPRIDFKDRPNPVRIRISDGKPALSVDMKIRCSAMTWDKHGRMFLLDGAAEIHAIPVREQRVCCCLFI